MGKRKFVADGVFNAELNEFLMRTLAEDGYAGVEVRVTPIRTEIIIRATRTREVLGEKGRRIRELTAVVQKRYGFPENSVELFAERVENRASCAMAQCESLRYKLLGVLGIKVKIMLAHDPEGRMGPKIPLPDNVIVHEPREDVPVMQPAAEEGYGGYENQ